MEDRDSFIFYKSFYEAMEDVEDKNKLEIFNAICKMALYDEEVELKGISATLFKLIKPQLKANTKKFKDGKKGGRPKKKTTGLKKEETTGFKNKKPNVNDNVNVNENYNYNDNEILIDNKNKYISLLGLDKFDYEIVPEKTKQQIDLYKRTIMVLCKEKREDILNNLNIGLLSKCYEKMMQQQDIINKLNYFVTSIKNEVQKNE